MSLLDWFIVAVYLVWIVWDGLRLTRRADRIEGYFLASRSLPWWAVGLSVMATQLSAITMIGTTGQGYAVGMSLLQQYYALPLAMVILAVTFVPFFHRASIYTAYEYLERRFDARTRAFTAVLFLLSRGMSTGAVISAPAVVLSVMMGVDVTTTCLLFGIPTAIYTMFGGVQAVAWTDVKQMYLIVFGLVAAVVALVAGLPDGVGAGDALAVAASTGRLQMFDFSLDPTRSYTFWSGTIGALFLFLSYFGTDQSQVQRYLTARSVDEARTSLFMSAYWKIPLQALVLAIGVFMFAFYLFTPPPMLFNPVHERELRSGAASAEYAALDREFAEAIEARRAAAGRVVSARQSGGGSASVAESQAAFEAAERRVGGIRSEAVALVRRVTGDAGYNDINYVFPTFVVTHMPAGLVGLLMAAIFAAAMSTIAGELSALSTASVMDIYRRWVRDDGDEKRLLAVSKLATLFWAVFASVVAIWAAELGSLIEVVNRFGSFFYGSILGVFLLAIGWPRANGTGAFAGLIAGMATVAYVATFTSVAFLWHNLIGAVVVFVVGVVSSAIVRDRRTP